MYKIEKPTLILLPALMCDESLFQSQVPKLKDYCNIIIPVIKNYNNIIEAAKYILRIAPETFYLAGISMGGYIAMEVTNIAKERVKKLCLISTKIDEDTALQKSARQEGINLALSTNNIVATQSYLASMLYNKNEHLYKLLQDMNEKLGVNTYVNQQKLILSRKTLLGKLKDFYSHTLIISGNDDKITPPKLLKNIQQEIPKSILISIPNCGHLASLDQPEALTSLLEYFIKI